MRVRMDAFNNAFSVAAVVIVAAVSAGISGCGLEPSGLDALTRPAAGSASAAAASVSSAASHQAPASQVPAVRATFIAAMTAVAEFGSPPQGWSVSVLSAIQTRQPVPAFSPTVASDMEAAGKAAIRQYFGPPQAPAELTALASAMALDREMFFINLGSGISSVSFGSVDVSAGTATVRARVTSWSRAVAREPLSDTWVTDAPVQVTDYTATLGRAPGGPWLILSLTSAPVPR